jgi:hypothetical protein
MRLRWSRREDSGGSAEARLLAIHELRQRTTYWAVIRAAKVGEWDNALAGIDRINVFVGGDPYLGTARADLLWLAGRADAARRQAAKTIEEDPSVKRYLCDELQQAAE